MKVLRPKSLFSLIYGLCMAIPFVAIAVTSLYVVCNKNAKDSYSGQIQYQQNVAVEKPTDLLQDRTYNIEVISNVATQSQNASYRIGFSNFTLKDYLIENGQTSINSATYFTIGGAVGYTNNACFSWYDTNMNYLGRTELPLNNEIVNNLTFVFTNLNTTSPAYFNDTFKDLIKVKNNIIVYDNTLSNVFYYAVNKFTSDNNFGEIDFFQWFRGMFLADTAQNNQWFNFINWYMNYAMLVSCAYILFLAMMWFINWARKILERGMNYDW